MPFVQLARQPLAEPGGELGGVDLARVHRQQFFSRVAKLPAGRRIGVENSSPLIVHEHRVVDAVKQGPGAAFRLDQGRLRLLPRLFGHDAFVDVGDEGVKPQRLARFITENVHDQLDRNQGTVLAAIILGHSLVVTRRQNLGMRPARDLQRLRRRQVHDRHPQELIARIADQLAERSVGQHDAAVKVDHGERLRARLQQPAKTPAPHSSRVVRPLPAAEPILGIVARAAPGESRSGQRRRGW